MNPIKHQKTGAFWNEFAFDAHWDIFYDLVEMQGYAGEIICPKCKRLTEYGAKDYKTCIACTKCRHPFSPTANTIFANSKIYLGLWLKAIHLIKVVNKNITLAELADKLQVTNVTACNMRKKIRTLTIDSIEYKLMKVYEGTFIINL